jgi:hypothetical protein
LATLQYMHNAGAQHKQSVQCGVANATCNFPSAKCTAHGRKGSRAFNTGRANPTCNFQGGWPQAKRSMCGSPTICTAHGRSAGRAFNTGRANPTCNFQGGWPQAKRSMCGSPVTCTAHGRSTSRAFNTGRAYTIRFYPWLHKGRGRSGGSRAGKGTRKQGVEQTFYSLCAGALLGYFYFSVVTSLIFRATLSRFT